MKPCLCRVNEIFRYSVSAADGIISQFYSKLNSVMKPVYIERERRKV